ncbi:MAG: DUF6314 family protein [Pseudomonadota bacterium]
MPTERRLLDFEGLWRIAREVRHGDGSVGQFAGTAQFTPAGDGLAYVEEGTLTLAGTALQATQRYHWGADLSVHFDDGRFFHHVPPLGGETSHWCAPDQYDGHYDFADWPAFTVTWTVTGPRKDYRMLSRYARSGSR